MSALPAWKEAGDQLLHVALSVAGTIWIALQPQQIGAYVVAAFWFSFWREDAQHRPEEGWRWMSPVEFNGMHKGYSVSIGGWRRWLDIGCSTLGGLVVGLVARFA